MMSCGDDQDDHSLPGPEVHLLQLVGLDPDQGEFVVGKKAGNETALAERPGGRGPRRDDERLRFSFDDVPVGQERSVGAQPRELVDVDPLDGDRRFLAGPQVLDPDLDPGRLGPAERVERGLGSVPGYGRIEILHEVLGELLRLGRNHGFVGPGGDAPGVHRDRHLGEEDPAVGHDGREDLHARPGRDGLGGPADRPDPSGRWRPGRD